MQTRWCKIIEPLVWLSWSFLSRLEIKYVMTSCLTSRLPATSNTKKVLSIYWTLCLINWAEILYVGLKSKFIIPLWLTSTPWVYPLMNFQMTWFTILFVTFFTCIRFFICVNPLMNFKVTWLSKLFVACSTFIRFFTYVNPHMSCFEFLFTILACMYMAFHLCLSFHDISVAHIHYISYHKIYMNIAFHMNTLNFTLSRSSRFFIGVNACKYKVCHLLIGLCINPLINFSLFRFSKCFAHEHKLSPKMMAVI